jgi:large subunit ribosomal protein L7Ae
VHTHAIVYVRPHALTYSLSRSFDDVRKQWGGGVMGVKSQAKTRAKERLIEKELRQRA